MDVRGCGLRFRVLNVHFEAGTIENRLQILSQCDPQKRCEVMFCGFRSSVDML